MVGAAVVSSLFPRPLPVLTGDGEPAAGEGQVTIGIRPEHIRVLSAPRPGAIEARLVRKAISIGRQYVLTIRAGEHMFKAKVAPAVGQALRSGPIWVELPPARVTLFDAAGHRVAATLAPSHEG